MKQIKVWVPEGIYDFDQDRFNKLELACSYLREVFCNDELVLITGLHGEKLIVDGEQ